MQHILSTLNQFQRLRKHNDSEISDFPTEDQLFIIAAIEDLELKLLQEETFIKSRKNNEQKIIALLFNQCSKDQMILLQKLIENENLLKKAL